MSDLVLGDRREGDVLLEQGRDPGPLRVPPAEDKLVVGDFYDFLNLIRHDNERSEVLTRTRGKSARTFRG